MTARSGSLERAVSGRIVLITGASSGIGRALALKLGTAGGIVLLVARRKAQLAELQREVEAAGGVAHAYPCDLSDPVEIDRMAVEVLERHGHVDLLVNNAGRSIRRSIDSSYERFHDFQRTMQLNYFGAVRLILDLLPAMRRHGSGQIVNISTAGVQTSAPMFSAYLASKAALDAFSRSLSLEVHGDGIAVSTVYMPLVRTPMIVPTRAFEQWPALTPDEAAELVCTAIRRRCARVAEPLATLGQVSYAVAPGHDRVINLGFARLRLGRRWRKLLAASPNDAPATADSAWREAFRRRLERTQVATDPDEVRRLAAQLSRVPLFERCARTELHRLAATAYPIVFDEGDVVCVEGADASDCYLVVEGEAAVSIAGENVGRVRANEVVGERALVEDRPRSATVVARTRLLAYAISSDRLTQLLRTSPDAAAHMRQLVTARYARPVVGRAAPLARATSRTAP